MLLMPRVQEVVIPILREDFPEAQVGSWVSYIKDRNYPMINVRRMGGYPVDPAMLDRATIELTVYGNVNLAETERLLLDAQIAIWDAVRTQRTVPDKGYLHSYRQTMGPTQFDSPYDNTWRVQSLIQLGLRPLPN